MCEECRHWPCVSSCPNFVAEPVCYCDNCGGEIYSGEHYYRITIEGYPTQNLCEECVDSFGEYADSEEYEPDPCDLAKAYEEERMLKDAEF